MKTRLFEVSVIGSNANTFYEKYKDYVISQNPLHFDNVNFVLVVSLEVYDEIENLTEEGIEIV